MYYDENSFRNLQYKIAGICFLVMLLCLGFIFLTAPVHAAIINPSVESQPFFCKYEITAWTPLCPKGSGGAGTQGPPGTPGTGNTTNYFNFTSMSNFTTISNITTFFNVSGNITNYADTINIITYSEMNQTPGPKGDKGDDGYTPVFGVDYFNGSQGINGTPGYTPVFGVDYFNGSDGYTPVFGVDYFNGSDGVPGSPGTPGYTPVFGVDYFNGTDGLNNMTMNLTANMTMNMTTGPAGPAGQDANVSTMYPVSSVYGTTSTSNPNTLLGAGTWAPVYNISSVISYVNFSPIMTSNTLPSGNITSAKSEYSGTYAAWKASDGITSGSTFWGSADGIMPNWWMLQFPSSKIISNYTIYPRGDSAAYNINTWKLNASTDGSTWTTLDTRTGVTWTTAAQSFPFSNSNAYTYYNISITSVNGGSGIGFSEVVFWNQSTTSKGVYYWERTA